MNFLRDGSVPLPETSKGVAELLAEAKYYCITELAESCERALLKKVNIDETKWLSHTYTQNVTKAFVQRN